MRYLSLSSLRVRLVLLVFASIAPAVALILYGAAEQRGYAAVAAQENAIRLAREVAADHEQLLDGARLSWDAKKQGPCGLNQAAPRERGRPWCRALRCSPA